MRGVAVTATMARVIITNLYCTLFGAADWGMLYKYVSHTTLSFGTARPEGDLYYNCGSSVLSTWRADQPNPWEQIPPYINW